MSFFELIEQVRSNIEYWRGYIFRRTYGKMLKDDAAQELLIVVFRDWSKRKKVTKYYIQKRLQYATIRILRDYNNNNETNLNPLYIEELRKKAKGTNEEEFNFEVFIEEDQGIIQNQIEEMIDRMNREDVLNELMYKLSMEKPIVRKVFELLYVKNNSMRQAVKELHMKKSNVFKIKKNKLEKIVNSLAKKLN